jgi:alpha-galactosidase
VIAIDQDPAGRQARRVRRADGIETWVKPLAGHSWAVLFLNRRTRARQIDVRLADVPRLPHAAGFTVRDLWAHASREVAAADAQRIELAGHDAAVWRVTPR